MKLLLLVSLPLLASTYVTLAKSILHGGRENVTDSLDMSPRGLSSVRHLKQDTTSGKRHRTKNAEERFMAVSPEEFAHLVKNNLPLVRGSVPPPEIRNPSPEALFQRLDFNNLDDVFTSEGFKTWFHAVHRRDEGDAANTIIKALREKVSDDIELALILQKTAYSGPRKEGMAPYDYLLSKWVSEGDDKWTVMLKTFEEMVKDKTREPDSLQHIWYDLALRAGMHNYDAAIKFHELDMASIRKSKPKKPTQ